MATLALSLGWLAIGLIFSQRLIWIACTRLGWAFYLANVAGEVGPKRLKVRRELLDAGIVLVGVAMLALGGISFLLLAWVVVVMLAQEVVVQRSERRLLDAVWVRKDSIGAVPEGEMAERGLARGYPSPSTHPELTINIVAPFVRRQPRFSLGTLVVGRGFCVEVIIANHALTPTQTPVRLRVETPSYLTLVGTSERLIPVVAPGGVQRVVLELQVTAAGEKSMIGLRLEWGDTHWRRDLIVDRSLESCPPVRQARIERYPGARRAAFAWRGDMDLYDTSTLQSIEGLELTFGLAARYRMPQTMYLSTRLSLDQDEACRWAEHYGVDRGAGFIPSLIDWMRSKVDLCHRAEYPFESGKPYLVELGNHGHLHYGTDTSAAEGNGWNPRSRMGTGSYQWTSGATGSFEEQRDNAIEARCWIERLFGFTAKSWAMPDRTRDQYTPRAMEAAGCEVLSDSDVRTRDNVLRQPRPHFAPGSGAVELTKRYPGDPQHILHYWMNLFWVHRACRLGIPVIFMCHQHLRLYDGWACTRLTEAVLRYVVDRCDGELWINTVYGVGVYWRDFLSEKRVVSTAVEDGQVLVQLAGSLDHSAVPVDLFLEGGGRATVLVNLKPGASVRLDARGIAT